MGRTRLNRVYIIDFYIPQRPASRSRYSSSYYDGSLRPLRLCKSCGLCKSIGDDSEPRDGLLLQIPTVQYSANAESRGVTAQSPQ